METQQTNPKQENCQHCRHNPNATKPFDKMNRLPMKHWEEIEQIARADGKDPNCFVCELVQGAIDALSRKD